MKNKVSVSILAFIIALLLTISVNAPAILILPLFVLSYALLESIYNTLNHNKAHESKQIIFISICGLVSLLSLVFGITQNGYKLITYIMLCLGLIGLLISLATCATKKES